MKRIYQITLIFIATILISSCVTQKKKGEISGIKKVYHNTTARYNGYFNADVLLSEAMVKLNEEHSDNYNKVLPLYEYVAVENAQSVSSDLDEAIKKVSIVVSLHREANWTDDSYLLIGKAQYLKKDYEGAEETLRYFSDNFSPEALKKKKKKSGKKKGKKKKKRKKKKSSSKRKKVSGKKKSSSSKDTQIASSKKTTDKPDKYFMKHRPNFQEGQLWLARVLIERERFNEANQIISKLNRDSKTFKDVKAGIPEVQAYYYLKQKEYENAIVPLGLAIESAKKRNHKARFAYILAQIHQNADHSQLALENFEKAMKFSNDYEMEFSARLSMTKNAWATNKSTSEEVISKLNKMLKDVKNEEYKDQIYFTLAEIALKDGDKKGGIAYLQKSVFYSQTNSAQKGESYYKLATLFYEDEIYVAAKYYYDTTLVNIAKTDERYNEVSRLSKSLTDIAKNIQIIELQDSLLVLSEMSEDEKRNIAFNIFKEIQKEEERKKQAAKAKAAINKKRTTPKAVQFGQGGRSASGGASSSFFAYNDRPLKKGKKDFQKRWGSRQLEDNWRRSSKRGGGEFGDEEVTDEERAKEMSEEDIAAILKDVPKTDAEKTAAKQKIENATFKLGTLFRDRLENYKKSVVTLDDLLKRFPQTKEELNAWYYLYLDHKDLNNNTLAKTYFDKIIKKYPTTTFARSLSDPNFLETVQNEKNKLVHYYDETYSVFEQKQFKSAFDRIAKVATMFGPTNALQAKFALLQSMCIGNLQGKKAYVNSLKDVIAKYPSTAEQKRAKEILRLINGGPASVSATGKKPKQGSKDDTEAAALFKAEDSKVHYFIAVLEEKTKLNDAKRTVSDYNLKYHKLEKLRISNIYLGTNPGIPLLVIRRFKNKTAAMKYYKGVANQVDDYMPEGISFKFYITTQNNYRQILKTKSLNGYDTFFSENYLK